MTPAQQHPILSIKDLQTYFFQDEGVVHAVDGASFDLYPGQTLGIVGESGCGKTVMLKNMIGLVKPTLGKCGFSYPATAAS